MTYAPGVPFGFDPDITVACTPPPSVYTDPSMVTLERERVFARTWQLVARADQLAATGDFATATIGDEPVVIVRDGDALRGFHNVCRHRGGPVATGCGRRQTLQCRYHGWTYGLDGALRTAPEMEGSRIFEARAWPLRPIEVGVRGSLVFASLEPACSLEEFLEGIELDPALRFAMRRVYELDANWKVYVDNYLEGYHIPVVHPELHKELDYDAYRTETAGYWSRQHAPLRPAKGAADGRTYVPRPGDDDAAYYWIFPNMMLNIYQGQLQTNVVVPLGPDRTRVVFEWLAADVPDDPMTDPTWSRLVEFSDLVQEQDQDICETVYRNMRSRACAPGPYSAKRENGVHHFHGLLHRFLTTT